MSEVFISYSSEDVERARELAHALEKEGWNVWWDRRILPGQRFDQVIRSAIDEAACVVVLWSESSVDSDWVKEEAEQAMLRDCLLPVVIDQVAPPLGFGRIQTGSLVGWTGERDHRGYASLLLALANFAAPDSSTSGLTSTTTPFTGEDSPPGAVSRYETRRPLGSGSFATVWLAYDPDLDADVAVKVLAENWSLDADIKRRFVEEARILRRLEHPSITRVYDVGEHEGRPFFVMEYADRGSLLDRMQGRRAAGRPYEVAEATAISEAIAEALEVAHINGVVHRDLKPSNVLFRSDKGRLGGNGERTMLADFGIARNLQAASGYTISAGTPHYAAPEQADGQADARSDIHAAGAVLFEMLAGEVPYPYPSIGQVLSVQRAEGPPSIAAIRADVPAGLDALIREAMAVDPDRRIPTAAAWRARLGSVDSAEPEAPSTYVPASKPAAEASGPELAEPGADTVPTPPHPTLPVERYDQATISADRVPEDLPGGSPGRSATNPPDRPPSTPAAKGTRRRWWPVAVVVVAIAAIAGALVLTDTENATTAQDTSPTTTTRARDPVAQAAFEEGESLLEAGAFEQALGQYDEALRIEPDAAEYERQWGVANFRSAWESSWDLGYWGGAAPGVTAQFEAAEASFRRASELDPGDATTWLYFARVGHDTNFDGQDGGAMAATVARADAVIALDPDGWGGYQVKALTHLALGQWDEAIGAASTAIDLGAADPDFLAGVWGGVGTGTWHDVAEMYLTLGHAQMNLGDYETAVESLGGCLELYSADHQCLFHRGESHEELGNVAAAASDYRNFLISPEGAGWSEAINDASDFLAERLQPGIEAFLVNPTKLEVHALNGPSDDWIVSSDSDVTFSNGAAVVKGRGGIAALLGRTSTIPSDRAYVISFSFADTSDVFNMNIHSSPQLTAGYRELGYFFGSEPRQADVEVWVGRSSPPAVIPIQTSFVPGVEYAALLAVTDDDEFLFAVWDPASPSTSVRFSDEVSGTTAAAPYELFIHGSEGLLTVYDVKLLSFDSLA